MTEQISQLEDKVTQLLDRFDELKGDNESLRRENETLVGEVARLSREFKTLQVNHNDHTDLIKTKLSSVLSRIDELAKIGL